MSSQTIPEDGLPRTTLSSVGAMIVESAIYAAPPGSRGFRSGPLGTPAPRWTHLTQTEIKRMLDSED